MTKTELWNYLELEFKNCKFGITFWNKKNIMKYETTKLLIENIMLLRLYHIQHTRIYIRDDDHKTFEQNVKWCQKTKNLERETQACVYEQVSFIMSSVRFSWMIRNTPSFEILQSLKDALWLITPITQVLPQSFFNESYFTRASWRK